MKTLDIDIETRSSVDLTKCGAYKYAESPDFEILLFGYSVDDPSRAGGGEVTVIDLANGETVPLDIIDALTDDSVEKWAHNAAFERVCLSRWLRDQGVSLDPFADNHHSAAVLGKAKFLNPESWRCSMVWCAYMGLPLSLEGAGKVLQLENQKMTEGKRLIRKFCTPPRVNTNDGIIPDPDWELFKQYNKRDVETEMAIATKLAKFLVSESEWALYALDQQINDCGVELDMELVRNAIALDERSRAELMGKMRELTELDNPNSTLQLKNWLRDNGCEVESLGKKEVAALAKDTPLKLAAALTIRLQLAKSSVSKYRAMENCVCADNRVRGLFQFCGASRTGRWCLTGDHEVLTKNGWIRLDEWRSGEIACWQPNGTIVSFQKAEPVSFDYAGDMLHYCDKRIDQISTPDHKMYVKRRYNAPWQSDTVENMQNYRPSIPFTGTRSVNSGLEHAQLRVLVMVQADGHYSVDGGIRLKFVKQRKVERCRSLLRKADVAFSEQIYASNERATVFLINSRDVPIWLRLFRDKTFGAWLFDESADVFFEELAYWDGYHSAANSIQYSTCNKQNADMVQAFAHISGRSAVIRAKERNERKPNWNTCYAVDIWLTPKNCHEIRNKPTTEHFEGKVYCAVTTTGYFLVRRNGTVWITGNSGRLLQPQNLPQNHLPDLEQARDLVKRGDFGTLEMLYDSVPDVLSQLIRTAFVPKEGRKFIVADFSAIEARVIAWLAGETWRNEVFATHGKIYEASASQMFKVPMEQITKDSPLRQKGKIAELALGYGGSVGALKAMGALDMGLTEEELQPLVTAWRKSNPNIVKLWWAVDKAAKRAVGEHEPTECYGIKFECYSGMLFITLPSGRRLAYVKPRIGENRYGGESVTYEGIGGTKKWERLDSYGPKFVENIVQAISRDILAYALQTFRCSAITMHIHDEIVIEADNRCSLPVVCEQMSRTPPWATGLLLRADGYETQFYKKD
jgi:hypothetical protein